MRKLFLILFACLSLVGYGQETKSQLTTRFDVIRNETAVGGNTKIRVANAYQELLNGTISIYPIEASGTDNYTAPLIGLSGYSSRMYFVTFENTNTGPVTLSINSIVADNVRKWNGSAWVELEAGDIKADHLYKLHHDGVWFQIYLEGGGGTALTFSNLLTESSGAVKLGGTATESTSLELGANDLFIYTNGGTTDGNLYVSPNQGVELRSDKADVYVNADGFLATSDTGSSTVLQSGSSTSDIALISLTGNTTPSIIVETGASTTNFPGMQYDRDYSANYTDRSLVDKGYVDLYGKVFTSGLTGTDTVRLGGTLLEATSIDANGNQFSIFGAVPMEINGDVVNISGDDDVIIDAGIDDVTLTAGDNIAINGASVSINASGYILNISGDNGEINFDAEGAGIGGAYVGLKNTNTGTSAVLGVLKTAAVTNSITRTAYIGAQSSGTTAAGFGSSIDVELETSDAGMQSAGNISLAYSTAASATRSTTFNVEVASAGSLTPAATFYGGTNLQARFYGPIKLKEYATGSLPTASSHQYAIAYDNTVGAIVVSNGTTWSAVGSTTDASISATAYDLTPTSASTSGNITLDMGSKKQRAFNGSATFSTAKSISLSNTTNSFSFLFTFEVTNVAATLTVPADWYFNSPDYNTSVWTPPATGKYFMSGKYDSVLSAWFININGPYTH